MRYLFILLLTGCSTLPIPERDKALLSKNVSEIGELSQKLATTVVTRASGDINPFAPHKVIIELDRSYAEKKAKQQRSVSSESNKSEGK